MEVFIHGLFHQLTGNGMNYLIIDKISNTIEKEIVWPLCSKAKGSMTKNIGPLTSPLNSNGKTSVLLINFILGNNNYTGSVMDLNQGRQGAV